MTIQRVLVANRGEIARRVFATCRRLGIGTVAVHSDADAGLPFVREADVAVRLPGNAPAETYLDVDRVLDAARRTGADAIHPGYGFLSENAAFARAVIAAGLTWIGPSPESIDAMGSKVAAKALMADAGVPVFRALAPDAVTEADLPVLVKASAGGGGRGMRVVRRLEDVADQVALAADEAGSAFGDDTVFLEPYLEHGRHVEVQVIGDQHGNVAVFGERDCSLQRRHQKVVEESPAPGLSDDVRATLHEGARTAARAIGYVGAGTVEFMVSDEKVSFLEMNTRLQVEHPVTEAVFGVDLVALQIAVAEGHRVAEPGSPRGHAVEVRLYAEDPAQDWRPQTGRLTRFDIPHDVALARLAEHGVRLDSGYAGGSEVSTFYDAMLAKVIAWGPDRASVLRSLAGVLERSRINGLTTNRDLLVRLLRADDVVAGRMTTDLLEQRTDLHTSTPDPGAVTAAVFAAAVAEAEEQRTARTVQRGIPVAWRNVVSQPQRTSFEVAGERVDVDWFHDRDGYHHATLDLHATVDDGAVVVTADGVQGHHDPQKSPDGASWAVDSAVLCIEVALVPRFTDPADQVSAGSLLAPMPGTVVSVAVSTGDRVGQGQTVLVLEAMKMQHTVAAPTDGLVTEIDVVPGDQVAAGTVLAVVCDDADQTHEETP